MAEPVERVSVTDDVSDKVYRQVTSDQSVGKQIASGTKSSTDNSLSKRDLTSNGVTDGERKSDSVRESVTNRNENSNNLTNRITTERANLAFQISFSIPLTGIIPVKNC